MPPLELVVKHLNCLLRIGGLFNIELVETRKESVVDTCISKFHNATEFADEKDMLYAAFRELVREKDGLSGA
jgi:diacylglycerol kinase